MEYRIQKYDPGMKEEVAGLTRLLWSEDPRLNRSYFEWKYERNPYSETPRVYVALHGDKVVGMRGLFGARWEVDSSGNTRVIFCADDLIVHPNHRNKNLFGRIMQAAYNDLAAMGHDYIFNLSAGPVNFVASMATGWRKTAPVQALIRPPSRRLLRRRLRNRLQSLRFLWRISNAPIWFFQAEPMPFRSLDHQDFKASRPMDSRITIEKNPRSQDMANLVNRLNDDDRIRHIRDIEYFNWRFQNPLLEHRFLYWDDGGLKGYLVLGHAVSRVKDFDRIRLLDWEGVDETIRVDLLKAAIDAGRYHEMITWSAGFSALSKDLLLKVGFKPLPKHGQMNHQLPCVLVRAVRNDLLKSEWILGNKRLLDSDNWCLRLLYGL